MKHNYKFNDTYENRIREPQYTDIVNSELPVTLNNTCEGPFNKFNISGNTKQEVIEAVAGTTLTGEGIVTANDVDTTKEHRITPIGNTHQDSYTGKNLFGVDNFTTNTINGVTITYNPITQELTFNGTCDTNNTTFTLSTSKTLPAGTYTQKYYEIGGTATLVGCVFQNFFYQSLSTNPTTSTITERTQAIQFRCNSGSIFNNWKIKVQLEEGSTATEWERFVGGTASPNPDYPQNIVNVGNNLNVFDKSETPITNVGVSKAEIDTGVRITLTQAQGSRSSYIPIKNINLLLGKTLTLSSIITPSGNNIGQIYIFWVNKSTYEIVGNYVARLFSSGSITFTLPSEIPSGATDLCLLCYGNGNQTTGINIGDYVDYTELKLEPSPQPTGYTPYNRGGIDVKVENKNILNTSSTKTVKNENGADRNGYYCKIPRTGTYYIYISPVTDDLYYGKSTNLASNTTSIGLASHGNTSTREYTFNAGEYFIIWGANNPSTNDKIMLAYGNETSYIAHQEQNITIPLPTGMELCKIGEYSDKIFYNIPTNPMYNASLIEGGWYKYEIIKNKILKGTETWNSGATASNDYYTARIEASDSVTTNSYNPETNPLIIDDTFSLIEYSELYAADREGIARFYGTSSAGNNRIYISILKSRLTYVSTWSSALKTWLSTHNVTLKYVLEEPVYTQITDTDTITALNTMESFALYEGVTNVYLESGIDGNIELKYNYITPAPSPARASDVISVGDNIQLLNLTGNVKESVANLTLTENADGSIKIEGTPNATYGRITNEITQSIPAGTYTFSIDTSLPHRTYMNIILIDDTVATGSTIEAGKTSATFTINKSIKKYSISISNISTSTNYNENIFYKLEKGSTSTGHTPYGKGGISILAQNKNIFNDTFEVGSIDSSGDNSSSSVNIRNVHYVRVQPNTNYVISINGYTNNIGLRYYDRNTTFISSQSSKASPRSFTTPENCYYMRFVVVNTTNTAIKVQIEKGTTKTDFIPHAEQKVTIPLPIGMKLCKIGEYSDKIFHNIPGNSMYNAGLIEGSWYKYNAINEHTLVDTDNIVYDGDTIFYTNNISNILSGDSIIIIMSNNFKGVSFNDRSSSGNNIIYTRNGTVYIRHTSFNSLNEFNAFLQQNEVKLQYILVTPTYTEITDTNTLEALTKMEQLITYKEQTLIITPDDISPIMEVQGFNNDEASQNYAYTKYNFNKVNKLENELYFGNITASNVNVNPTDTSNKNIWIETD